jgi:glycerol-3-phosphate dehydrogenase (NAD(P)+)
LPPASRKAEAHEEIRQVVEGVSAAREVRRLASQRDVEMPIAESIYKVLFEDFSAREAVESLFERERKAEMS